VGDEHPSDSACDGDLEILGETAAPAEPRECALDDPSAWQYFEALGAISDLLMISNVHASPMDLPHAHPSRASP